MAGKRFDTLLFPQGKGKAFTLSYDDGVVQDRRLVELFDKYGVKCTFNLNYGTLGFKDEVKRFTDISKIEKEEVRELYKNHEVAGHGLYHSSLPDVKSPLAMYEIIEDKVQLEKLTGKPLRMFAYPFGLYSDEVIDLLSKAGYMGARTVNSTHDFAIPKNFLAWDPTCHHDDEQLMELLQKFVDEKAIGARLFYLWGHGYEFDGRNNWDVIENAVAFVAEHKDKIWFATNGEIIEYVMAYNRLQYSGDGSYIYNPSCIDVTILAAFGHVITLKAGEITEIPQMPL